MLNPSAPSVDAATAAIIAKLPWSIHPECCWGNLRPDKVEEYKIRLLQGEVPPPVVIHKNEFLDGLTRAAAHVAAGFDIKTLAYTVLPDDSDPGVYVNTQHQGTRNFGVAEMAEQVTRRMASTGKSFEECLQLVPEKRRNLVRSRFARTRLARTQLASLPPKAPRAAVIHRQPGAAPHADTLIRAIIPDSHGEHIDIPARDAFLTDLKDLDVHEIVMLGDHLDCGGTMSTHQKSYSSEKTESYTDDCTAANVFLDKIQRAAPKAVIHYLEGNHEQHVERWAVREFESKKDADKILERIGPASMLSLAKRGITYYQRSEMYMGLSIPGTIKLGKCYFVHGVSHSKNADQAHLQRFGDNVVFGHVHRVQSMNTRTVTSEGHGSWCPGTLAKLQPLYAHTAPTEWSHGYGVQFVAKSGEFIHINVPIHKGKSMLRLTGLFDRLAANA